MRIKPNQLFRQLLVTLVVTSSCLSMGFAWAITPESNNAGVKSWVNGSERQQSSGEWQSVVRPLRWVQNDKSNFRSKSDVVREVKSRYGARVLKISLNKQREIYNVRILMPGGKIRNIKVSARR